MIEKDRKEVEMGKKTTIKTMSKRNMITKQDKRVYEKLSIDVLQDLEVNHR